MSGGGVLQNRENPPPPGYGLGGCMLWIRLAEMVESTQKRPMKINSKAIVKLHLLHASSLENNISNFAELANMMTFDPNLHVPHTHTHKPLSHVHVGYIIYIGSTAAKDQVNNGFSFYRTPTRGLVPPFSELHGPQVRRLMGPKPVAWQGPVAWALP